MSDFLSIFSSCQYRPTNRISFNDTTPLFFQVLPSSSSTSDAESSREGKIKHEPVMSKDFLLSPFSGTCVNLMYFLKCKFLRPYVLLTHLFVHFLFLTSWQAQCLQILTSNAVQTNMTGSQPSKQTNSSFCQDQVNSFNLSQGDLCLWKASKVLANVLYVQTVDDRSGSGGLRHCNEGNEGDSPGSNQDHQDDETTICTCFITRQVDI